MAKIANNLNPFAPMSSKKIKTPWGSIKPKVDIFPILYLLFIYGFIYILPYGRDIIGISWFDWFRQEDGPLEWLQFIGYFLAFIFAAKVTYRKSKSRVFYEYFPWLILTLLCFFVAGEEISWGERITGVGIEAIREINRQGESNIHNIQFFHHILLDPSFEISCLILGWFGWRRWPNLDVFPKKQFSLYFLFVALFFFYFDISYSSTIKQIRNDQEIFELLMSLGLLLHCWQNSRRKRTNSELIT